MAAEEYQVAASEECGTQGYRVVNPIGSSMRKPIQTILANSLGFIAAPFLESPEKCS
jgi:hypothetical protein